MFNNLTPSSKKEHVFVTKCNLDFVLKNEFKIKENKIQESMDTFRINDFFFY